ncbi:hypothetical protein BpHYR1_020092 [Brachionus plicatilis]|uniref:Uncharacterized protein n=1 Tax=Brachionus plicatilis TaxID=10195 RepID=A0A3M7Q008_BRAPC|nr:hypothetical protein BpHYR1_020092 [Brachionus plicatilis]
MSLKSVKTSFSNNSNSKLNPISSSVDLSKVYSTNSNKTRNLNEILDYLMSFLTKQKRYNNKKLNSFIYHLQIVFNQFNEIAKFFFGEKSISIKVHDVDSQSNWDQVLFGICA